MKHMKYLAALAVLAGCSDNTAIKDAIKSGLKDPDSAEFGEIGVAQGPKGKWSCVTVNARNSFGGYTGDKQIALKHVAPKGWIWIGEPTDITHETCMEYASTAATGEDHKDAP